MKESAQNLFFRKYLNDWNINLNDRKMPWKGEKNPYKIWLSEIILQQTRVEQGLAYYNKFIKTFPTVHDLAKSQETTVFKLWEGLGYYSRCKNLIITAKYISTELKGKFPDTYEAILALKGIGPYTAAALASFAYNLPYAVVDGNVYRVLARYFNIEVPVDSDKGKKLFFDLANSLLDKNQPGRYNQAIMDFGAVICKPKLPLCAKCILQPKCRAYSKNSVSKLPIKKKKIIKHTRWLNYVLVEFGHTIYVRKRSPGDIWENLYEFMPLETAKEISQGTLQKLINHTELPGNPGFQVIQISKTYQQILTHRIIKGRFVRIRIEQSLAIPGFQKVTLKHLEKIKNSIPHELRKNFYFPGSVPDIEKYLSICKTGVLTSTSLHGEGVSNSVLEYMAGGLVPIVTDIGGSSEIIENGTNGFLIPEKGVNEIIKNVTNIKNDKELFAKIKSEALKTIQEKFDMKKNISKLLLLYTDLINKSLPQTVS